LRGGRRQAPRGRLAARPDRGHPPRQGRHRSPRPLPPARQGEGDRPRLRPRLTRLAASGREQENPAVNSVLKGVLSRGGADLLQLAMGIAGSVFSVKIFFLPVLAFDKGHVIVMTGIM